jgi:hypothetical protein
MHDLFVFRHLSLRSCIQSVTGITSKNKKNEGRFFSGSGLYFPYNPIFVHGVLVKTTKLPGPPGKEVFLNRNALKQLADWCSGIPEFQLFIFFINNDLLVFVDFSFQDHF